MLNYVFYSVRIAPVMSRVLVTFAALQLLGTSSVADTPGIRAGANYWNYDISGTARYKSKSSSDNIDVNRDLGYNNGSAGVYYLVLEHPMPLLPNVRLTYTDIDDDANGRLSKTFVYGNATYFANEAVISQIKLKQTDVTLYYELLDNVVSLDLGLDAKYIDSKARISGEISGTQDASVSGWVPLAYAGIGGDLPLTGLGVCADGSFSRYQGSRFYDYSIRVTYTTPWHIGLDAGYRKIKMNLDDFDNSFADIEFDGPYAGAYLNF
ncbi:MAG: TIGR04219 family outer membrane beta-barrel protein [Gammaproteobacteria bacterium]